jgi:HlyD family secretion protein
VKWIKWMLAAGLAALSAAGALLWRAHLQNANTYQTVAVERCAVQARITTTGNLNAVVDVLVSSQVSGNIKALYADSNSKVKKGNWSPS